MGSTAVTASASHVGSGLTSSTSDQSNHLIFKRWDSNGPVEGVILSLAIDSGNVNTLYAGTLGGELYKSSDRGRNWNRLDNGLPNTNIYALTIDPISIATIYAGADKRRNPSTMQQREVTGVEPVACNHPLNTNKQ
jgi:hypothetical protein